MLQAERLTPNVPKLTGETLKTTCSSKMLHFFVKSRLKKPGYTAIYFYYETLFEQNPKKSILHGILVHF